jgi:hypothetical protein
MFRLTSVWHANKKIVSTVYPSAGQVETMYRNFVKAISGYHSIHDEPLKESSWKQVQRMIFQESGLWDSKKEDALFGRVRGTTSVYMPCGSKFRVASSRLTSVTCSRYPGKIEDIIETIKTQQEVDFYSMLVRTIKTESSYYDWYLVPSTDTYLKAEDYSWEEMIGKRGKHVEQSIGWKTKERDGCSMSIYFAMSSQLWMTIAKTEEWKKYRMGSCTIRKHPKYNYIQLHDELRDACHHTLFRPL